MAVWYSAPIWPFNIVYSQLCWFAFQPSALLRFLEHCAHSRAWFPESRAPYPYIVPTHYEQSVGRSHYDALQLQIDKKFSQGVAFTLNYTWSKAIDIACDGNFGSEGCFIRNPYNMNAEKSVAGFDLTNIFTANWVYQLPFGGDRRFRMKNRLANALVSGWQLNGLATLTSGPPFTVSYSGDEANTGNDFEGVDLVGNPTL